VNIFPTYKAARVHRSTGDAATWPIAVHVSRESTWKIEPRLRARGSAWQHDDRGVLPQDLNGQPANCFLRLSHQPRSTSDQLRKRPRVPMVQGRPARAAPSVCLVRGAVHAKAPCQGLAPSNVRAASSLSLGFSVSEQVDGFVSSGTSAVRPAAIAVATDSA
jgi:hypothetical protein